MKKLRIIAAALVFLFLMPRTVLCENEDAKGPKKKKPGFFERLTREKRPDFVAISKIKLAGCKNVPCRSVRAILGQKKTSLLRLDPMEEGYDPFWAEDDRRRIEMFYKGKGYYHAEVSAPEVKFKRNNKAVKIKYTIVEGEPVLVKNIEIIFIDGVHYEEDPETMKGLLEYKVDDAFDVELYQEGVGSIEVYYKNDAYHNTLVKRRAIVDAKNNTVEITYRITKGQRYKLRSLKVEGCEKTSPDVVLKSLDLELGRRYRRDKIFEAQRRVLILPIYQTVHLKESVDKETKMIDLTVLVKENDPRTFKAGIGYGSQEGIRVQGGWRHVNFLGGRGSLRCPPAGPLFLSRKKFLSPSPML